MNTFELTENTGLESIEIAIKNAFNNGKHFPTFTLHDFTFIDGAYYKNNVCSASLNQ